MAPEPESPFNPQERQAFADYLNARELNGKHTPDEVERMEKQALIPGYERRDFRRRLTEESNHSGQ